MQTQGIKQKKYIEIVCFPADILPSLIIVKEPEGIAQICSVKKFFSEISQNIFFHRTPLLAASKEPLKYYMMITISSAKFY